MKTLRTLFASLLLVGSAIAQTTNSRSFVIEFDVPEAEQRPSNQVFRLHGATSFAQPVSEWNVLNNDFALRGSTNGLITYTSTAPVVAYLPITFFVVSSSNEWGMVFSEVFATAPPAKTGRLRLKAN